MSKTGVPGCGMPGVLLMILAFPGNEKISTGAVVPILALADLIAVILYHKNCDWQKIKMLLPPVWIGLIVGTTILYAITNEQFKIIVPYLVLALLAFEEIRRFFQWTEFPKSKYFAWIFGGLAGTLTQLGNAAAPVMSVYLSAQNMPKRNFMGTWAMFFFIVNLSKLPLISGLNMINSQTLLFDLKILPGLMVGVLLGRFLFKIIREKYFVRIILFLNLLTALYSIFFY